MKLRNKLTLSTMSKIPEFVEPIDESLTKEKKMPKITIVGN